MQTLQWGWDGRDVKQLKLTKYAMIVHILTDFFL